MSQIPQWLRNKVLSCGRHVWKRPQQPAETALNVRKRPRQADKSAALVILCFVFRDLLGLRELHRLAATCRSLHLAFRTPSVPCTVEAFSAVQDFFKAKFRMWQWVLQQSESTNRVCWTHIFCRKHSLFLNYKTPDIV